jgi:hypothetical protein
MNLVASLTAARQDLKTIAHALSRRDNVWVQAVSTKTAAGFAVRKYAQMARASAPIEATREADRAAAQVWSIRMEGFGGPAQPDDLARARKITPHVWVRRPLSVFDFKRT